MELMNDLHLSLPPKLDVTESLPALLLEAADYLQMFYQEQSLLDDQLQKRLRDIEQDYWQWGTYQHTKDELAFGAKVAWRNSSRCIGRIFWESLIVRDLRHLTTADDIFTAIVDHIHTATNGGNVRSTISIFAPDPPGEPGIRIWNPLLLRYAGYCQSDGSIVGDPAQVKLTEICQQMGWVGLGTPFDLLPLIIQMPGQKPQLFELPPSIVMEVPITHPDYDWFAELGLKWHALPAVSDWRLEIGGISYSAAPFNGWYLSTEIGARNFGDEQRYNLLPIVGERLGLNTRSKLSLWKDRALLELNRAVLHSFTECGVTMVDHHNASKQFMRHCSQEAKAGRIVPADWGRIVPPLSASTMEVFHLEMQDTCLKPNFFPMPAPWTQRNSNEQNSQSFSPDNQQKQCPFHFST